jgi:2-oxoisovalerate dehydrogenase E2 component (dihydrolipoyl transacylase)
VLRNESDRSQPGIVECEIIQWFVEPGARVEEFSPLCEVQSDKASVEITSRFAGVVKKLYYEAGEMAKVGRPFVDIDIAGDVREEEVNRLASTGPDTAGEQSAIDSRMSENAAEVQSTMASDSPKDTLEKGDSASEEQLGRRANKALATPAVRHLSKELMVDIAEIRGTGKDGRVSKEDIYRFVKDGSNSGSQPPAAISSKVSSGLGSHGGGSFPADRVGSQTETPMKLTPTQQQMYKTMSRSLTIPHFLYGDELDFTSLCELRARLNKVLGSQVFSHVRHASSEIVEKLSYLPFIIKAVSLALYQHPILNARIDHPEPGLPNGKPSLMHRSQHNIGVAIDTPSGLLVPVIQDVGGRTILSIASELVRLQRLALAGQLSPQDLSGGTITVSNVGNIGGTYTTPVIVEKQVAILGIGRIRTVPAFDEEDRVVKKQVCNFSWSADHRVVDGATLARAADVVKRIVEEPDVMIMHLR